MSKNPYEPPQTEPSAKGEQRRHSRPYLVCSAITVGIVFMAVAVSWVYFGVTYSDGQVQVSDPTVRFETDANGDPFGIYDSIYMVDLTGFLIAIGIILALALIFSNLVVWLFRLVYFATRNRDGRIETSKS